MPQNPVKHGKKLQKEKKEKKKPSLKKANWESRLTTLISKMIAFARDISITILVLDLLTDAAKFALILFDF